MRLFPKEVKEKVGRFKLGRGYELNGRWNLAKEGWKACSFQGTLSGENFEVMGYRLAALNASIKMTSEKISLQHLILEDPAMWMNIKQIELQNNRGAQGRDIWSFDIPLIHVQNLKPSKLQRLGTAQPEIKPLVVKNVSLLEFKGILGEPSSFTGYGNLNFVNAFKKEFNFLDVPLELIKNVGLDPGLLTPVYGEVDYQIKAGRCYFTDLKNAYSEGKRSQFYLSPESQVSYMDPEGKLHVFVKMKQNVALKLTEPFTLVIGGTLEKPKVSLAK
jgi:hypothetical protein